MRKREYRVIIYLIISVIIYLLPLEGLEAEYSLRELVRIHYDQARSYYRQGEYSKAKAEFQKVLRLQPEHQGAQWYFKFVEKELAKDEKTFRSRIEKLLKKRGKGQERDQSIEKILDSLEKYQTKTDGAEKETAYFLRKTSVELMEEEKESEKLEEIKQLYEKGKSYFQRGLYSEALDYFEKVIELGENP